jgi:hypothetical protein
MQSLIVDIVTGLVKVIRTTREALAADLREIADKIEGGALVPDEAFAKAKVTLDKTRDAYDALPDG